MWLCIAGQKLIGTSTEIKTKDFRQLAESPLKPSLRFLLNVDT